MSKFADNSSSAKRHTMAKVFLASTLSVCSLTATSQGQAVSNASAISLSEPGGQSKLVQKSVDFGNVVPSGEAAKRAAWRRQMTHSQFSAPGCYETAYPKLAWRQIPCGVTSKTTTHAAVTDTRRPLNIGGTSGDYYLTLSKGSFTQLIGGLPQITNVTSVEGFCNPDGTCVPNEYTLQINTNLFANSNCPGGGKCAWEQFVYDSGGGVNIQYWLLGYLSSTNPQCPSGFAPYSNSTNCFAEPNPANGLPIHQFTTLAGATLTATVNQNGMDIATIDIPGDVMKSSVSDDSLLGLANSNWTTAEFNVFGEGNGTEAVFNTGASVFVSLSAETAAGSGLPTCVPNGGSEEAETTNLSIIPPCSSSGYQSGFLEESPKSPPLVPPSAPTQPDRLTANQGLIVGEKQSILSSDGRFTFTLQNDANVVLYGPGNKVLWASNTYTPTPSPWFLSMQADGNLVAYNRAGRAYWASNTAGNPGSWVVVQSDGNVVIYSAAGKAIWASNSVQTP